MIQTTAFNCLLAMLLSSFSISNLWSQSNLTFSKINPEHIEIVRDQWGVPHIYGKTDADAAYGLAWANAEDNFAVMQESLLAINGKLGSVKGKDGAILDVLNHISNPSKIVEEQFETAFTPEFRKVLNGYVQGLNAYARSHAKEILVKSVFPIKETDIIEGYVFSMTMMTNVQYEILRLFENKLIYDDLNSLARGSNAFAYNASKIQSGNPMLVVNSHQPLDGPFAWYEAHVNSEEGWNFLGGVLPGGITPFLGTNEHLGWAHTLNFPDLADVFELEMHPDKKLTYKFDNEWLKLEERHLKFKVKVGPVKIPIRKKFYTSKYGVTFKNKSGFFSLRFPSNMSIKSAEQWYYMNKATNLEEFQAALATQCIPGINTVYTDKDDNILFLGNGHFPYRDPSYNWDAVVPGNTSKTLWPAEFMPLDSLVYILNPNCGYLFNMNNTPFNCTCPEENPNPSHYNKTISYLTGDTGRSRRYSNLMKEYTGKLSYEEVLKIKFDQQSPNPFYTHNVENLEDFFKISPEKYPDIKEALDVISKWDRRSNIENKQAALIAVSIHHVVKHLIKQGNIDQDNSPEEIVYVNAIRKAQKHLKKHFGKLEIELGQLQKHVHGDIEIPIGGIPEVLGAMTTIPYNKGKFRSYLGDSYIQVVEYTKEGVQLETINCYGASAHEESPHFADQMQLFVDQKLKKMTLDKDQIYKNAKRVYHPGQ